MTPNNHDHSDELESHVQEKQSGLKMTNVLLILSIAVLLFGSGYSIGTWNAQNGKMDRNGYSITNAPSGDNIPKKAANLDFGLFWDVWDKVEQIYVDKKKVDPQKMFYGAMKGMVASIDDPYTFFLTPDENKQSKDDLGGKFEGIGAQLGLKANMIVVMAPLKNSPAFRAGILSGDIIVKVDGASTKGWTLPAAVSKIRGKGGTQVKLGINRDGKDLEFTITRETIKVDSVELSFENSKNGQVAYVKVVQFGETTNDEWDAAMKQVSDKWKKGEIKGLVLDLRDNPGGYLTSAVHLASEFLPAGKLVVKQESTTVPSQTYLVTNAGDLQEIPIVVLINRGSASASEIFSGALRDHKRAKLVGEKSFGKGSVQQPLDLKSGAGLHVTVAKWILPGGDWINGKGIEPEVAVELVRKEGETITKDTDTQLQKAIEIVLQ